MRNVLHPESIPSKTLLGKVLRTPLALVPKRLDVPVLAGPLRGMRWRVGSSTHGCWLGTYESGKVQALLGRVSSGMTVFDVGANAGYYTLAFSRAVGPSGRVVAFEPFAENLVNLQHHLAINGVTNCTLIQGALSGRNGLSTFRTGPSNSMGALSETEGALKVPTFTLDGLLDAAAIGLPDVVKMDVEGAEGDVLDGARQVLRKGRAVWFIALHGDAAKADCERILTQEGYAMFTLEDRPVAELVAERAVDEIYAVPRVSTGR